tara:strand:- start:1689 stop:2765 length:1077 start_codon:yes stop_codon:yes gene_type:complete
MSDETLTEALSKLDDDNSVSRAAVPSGRRVEEDVQEEDAIIEFSEEEAEGIEPVTEDSVKEDFEASYDNDEEELSEAEVKAKTAQGRINQAVKQAKEYQRRELQALQFAKELRDQNQQLSDQLQSTQTSSAEQNLKIQESYGNEFATRVETQAQSAKRNLKTAYESGDPEAMADAQQLLARAEADRSSLAKYQQELEDYKTQYSDWQEQQRYAQTQQYVEPEYQQPYQEPQYQEPSDKSQGWATKNEWFGKDKVMTNVAFAIHQDLVDQGVDLESDEYYAQIDSRMRSELPQKFNEQNFAGGNQQSVQTVVSGSRTTGSGRNQNSRRVALNPSEQALARKLGVPFKEYAKQKMRLQRS